MKRQMHQDDALFSKRYLSFVFGCAYCWLLIYVALPWN